MTAIAIIAPDGNRHVALTACLALPELVRAAPGDTRVTRDLFLPKGGWPFRLDRVYVCRPSGWRAFRPDDLPAKYW